MSVDLTWPSTIINPTEVEWGLVTPGSIFTNPLGGGIRTASIPGALWFAKFSWGDLDNANSAEVETLLLQLRGFANRLVVHNPGRPLLLGAGGGTPLVQGTAALGANTFTVDGLTPSITNIWKKGDLFSVVSAAASGTELKQLTANMTSNGSGVGTVTFEPPLRGAVADNAVIVVVKPTARFLPTSSKVSWLFRSTLVSGHTLELIEDVSA